MTPIVEVKGRAYKLIIGRPREETDLMFLKLLELFRKHRLKHVESCLIHNEGLDQRMLYQCYIAKGELLYFVNLYHVETREGRSFSILYQLPENHPFLAALRTYFREQEFVRDFMSLIDGGRVREYCFVHRFLPEHVLPLRFFADHRDKMDTRAMDPLDPWSKP